MHTSSYFYILIVSHFIRHLNVMPKIRSYIRCIPSSNTKKNDSNFCEVIIYLVFTSKHTLPLSNICLDIPKRNYARLKGIVSRDGG
jgi:hypothetical protein